MDTLEVIKKQIIGILTRWLLKIAGGFLLSIGLTDTNVETIVTSVVMLIGGIIISIMQNKKLAGTDPEEFQKRSK